MPVKRSFITILLLLAVPLLVVSQSRIKVSGRVFDMSQSVPLNAVTVLSTGGTGTITDSAGYYHIYVYETDSIWFSYLDKPTPKYPVLTIRNLQNFEVALHVNVTQLKEVFVKSPGYKLDSIRNRQEYAKAFNFKKPGIGINLNPGGAVGLDLDQFIRMFQFARNKRMLLFQKRLLREEQERFIQHRFTRSLVMSITNLQGPELDTFMRRYQPDLFFTQITTDYEFRLYIKQSYEKYMRLQKALSELKKEED